MERPVDREVAQLFFNPDAPGERLSLRIGNGNHDFTERRFWEIGSWERQDVGGLIEGAVSTVQFANRFVIDEDDLDAPSLIP